LFNVGNNADYRTTGKKNAIIYTDGFKPYDGLADFGYKKHYRIKHIQNQFADGHNHINGIDNFFWIL